MKPVRDRLVRKFQSVVRQTDPDETLGDAMCALLRVADEVEEAVDGWTLFRVTEESADLLEVVGLMTLLPTGSIPIAVRVSTASDGLAWSAELGEADSAWCGLSESKRWNMVYLYAGRSTQEPEWTWGRQYQGVMNG